jgi:alanine dehydrogenase
MLSVGILGAPPGVSEGRVLLTPRQAGLLDQAGARVTVERGAGERAGYCDGDYAAEGATLTSHRAEVLGDAHVVLAVARPSPAEVTTLGRGAVLMGFYHLDVQGRELQEAVQAAGAVAVGLERVVTPDGRFPFRERMAEVAGVLSAQLAARLLESGPSRGVLLGGVTGVPPAGVVIVGAGARGRSATREFAGGGASVQVLPRDRGARAMGEREQHRRVQTLLAGPAEIADAAAWADVLVGAVRVPEGRPPNLLTPFQGKPGAVWLDLSIDEGGCIEESRPVYTAEQAYQVESVLCCPVPNLASWAARTASRIGSALLYPVLATAAERGQLDLSAEPWLLAGAMR